MRQENERLRRTIEAQERKIAALEAHAAELEQHRSIARLPNKVAAPAQKTGIIALRETFERWEQEGKTGPQNFTNTVLAKQIGMDPRAASAVVERAEELGLIEVERYTTGERTAKRNHLRVAPTRLLYQDPSTWQAAPPRDPNGKGCDCNAGTYVTVTREQVRRYVTLVKCVKCNTVHKTTVRYSRKVKPRMDGAEKPFNTEAAADDYIRKAEKGNLPPETEGSCWSSNSASGGVDRRSYQSRSDIRKSSGHQASAWAFGADGRAP